MHIITSELVNAGYIGIKKKGKERKKIMRKKNETNTGKKKKIIISVRKKQLIKSPVGISVYTFIKLKSLVHVCYQASKSATEHSIITIPNLTEIGYRFIFNSYSLF